MIKGIEFLKNYNRSEMLDLTNNTIILCTNPTIKNDLVKLFIKEIGKDGDLLNYDSDEKTDTLSIEILFLPTTILNCRDQRFVVTVEPSIILASLTPKDIWFCNGDEIYAFTDFARYLYEWDKGITHVYKSTVAGRYGTYTGEFLSNYEVRK